MDLANFYRQGNDGTLPIKEYFFVHSRPFSQKIISFTKCSMKILNKIINEVSMMANNSNVTNTNKREGEQILEQFLKFMLEKDMDKWIDLWDEYAVFEFPFGPSNYPEKIEGKSNIYNYIKDFPKKINLFKFTTPQIHYTLNSNTLIAEFKCEGQVISTRLPYKQKYISVIEITNGKISHYKDYWNPLVAIESFGGNLTTFLDDSPNLNQ